MSVMYGVGGEFGYQKGLVDVNKRSSFNHEVV